MVAIELINFTESSEGQILGASSDEEAIKLFLSHRHYSKNTIVSYTKEIFRFIIWSDKELNKKFKDLSGKDFIHYSYFLKNIPTEWCNPIRTPRSDKAWRPFTASLSPMSHKHALTCLRSLFKWLAATKYLPCDPSVCITIPGTDQKMIKERVKSRCLSSHQLKTVMCLLSSQNTFEADRTRFLLSLMYFLGLRIHEVVKHKMNDFKCENGLWWFHCIGKGNKYRKIPVDDAMLQELARYRRKMGLSSYPDYFEKMPLAYSERTQKAMSDRRLSQIIKASMEEAAELLEGEQSIRLKAATAHWFRHTGITAQVEAGIPYSEISDNAGHESFDTTRLYIHTEDNQRHANMRFSKVF